jgi:hypothetical protein
MSHCARNARFGQIADEVVFYDPATGDVTVPATPNPIPEPAIDERRRVKFSHDPKAAAAQCGVPRISWKDVERVSFAQIDAFQKQHSLEKLLTGNAKTVKPRAATGRTGQIAGMNLSPHYYPDLLNIIPTNAKGALDFIPTNEFQAFSGDTTESALRVVNGPGAKQQLDKNDLLTFCAGSSRACRATCLVSTGQHAAGETHGYAKMRATYAFLLDPVTFVAALNHQLKLFACECQNEGKDAVVRLNMLSDLPWYEICPELLEAHEGSLAWYDYSKLPFWRSESYNRLWRGRGKSKRNILDLTFSFSGSNAKECAEALGLGYRVAAVFASTNLERKGILGPQRTSFQEILQSGLVGPDGRIELFGGRWLLVDGDNSDYRIDDPGYGPGTGEGCVVALNFKASSTIVGEFDWEKARKEREKEVKKALEEGRAPPEGPIVDRFAKARARRSEVVRTRGGVPQSRFEYAKEEFTVPVPQTKRGYAYAKAIGRNYWDELFGKEEAAAQLEKLSLSQVIEINEAYDRAAKRGGGAKAGVPAAREVLKSFGFGVVGEGASELPPGKVDLAMRPIVGTDLLIGPTVPTVTND